jgi:hypothetical protein
MASGVARVRIPDLEAYEQQVAERVSALQRRLAAIRDA